MKGDSAKALEELFKGAGKENMNLYGVSAYDLMNHKNKSMSKE